MAEENQEVLDRFVNNRLNIVVKPNSPKDKIAKWDAERSALIVEIAAQPENNKANIEVMKFFTRLLKKPVKIVSGLTSKKKAIQI